MNWMLLPYRRYAEFSGRSRRREFWMFALFQFLVAMAISTVFGSPYYGAGAGTLNATVLVGGTGAMVQNVFSLISFIPNLAVSVRRLHDQDKSGWLLLLLLVPLFGWFALFVLFCLDGTRGPNRFGPDPKNPTDLDAFA